ncbi:hypothetical protein HBI24_147810 [Parastagonospora nodorum]|nr:hypothetical protein HBH53_128070 [Parastagonospora nodorum]KAH4053010.1 hypothetical protein HBH49_093720 [Parastagonospora nodorum]KAH4068640.1 hypothetical protein HBH50_116680 [Parastagonospora nodorum]KAH4100231.1 hypothetical protein HBH48_018220 [Parastagonospora nodorum]KAH4190541.1 hypothetical protein HBH42_130330 [Parastagonospora nodorum]
MAQHNYGQPYYDLPFQFPPQQQMQQMQQSMAHAPPPNAQGSSQAMQPAPAPNAFYIPGLQQQAPPSNVNHHAYSQNAQQPPYPQAAWPPPDPAAFFAMMQSAAMNGQPPPPIPGFAFPSQSFLPPNSQYPAPPMPFPLPHQQQNTMAASDRIQEVMDSDREDGEVSESEAASLVPNGKAYGRTHAEPPRSAPQAKQASPRIEEGYNPDRPAAGQMKVKEPVRRASPQLPAPPPVDPIQRDRDQAKQFIKLLHSNNIGYRTLAKEPLDLEQLRGIYQSLNLPSEPAPILPPKEVAATQKLPSQASTNLAVQPVSGSSGHQPTPAPMLKTAVQAAPASSAAPSPVDRRDYIARLQAAKLAKQAGAAKASPPQHIPPVASAPAAQAVKAPQPITTPTPKAPMTDEQRARTTELIKQRLEAMRAGTKPSTPAATAPASVSSPFQKTEAKRLPASQRAPSGTTTPVHQSYNAGFTGIPGLFMQPSSSVDNASRPSPSVPQKRPAPVDSTEASTPRGSATPYTRPLGDSPHAYNEDQMIIEVSDDESNGSDMDIDNDQAPPSTSVQFPGMLPKLPSQPTSVLPGSSAASTPGPPTPATQAREKELKRKEDQLAAMKETLKKKLAEKRAKDKAAAAASSPAPQSASSEQNGIATSHQKHSNQLVQPPLNVLTTAPGDTMQDTNELSRDVKRRRRDEIVSKLPVFDVELASNTSRIAELMREMEVLRAQSQKLAEDKERLTRELESIGVDTEGMSHDEMRAKKDEIEHEMPSERESMAANAGTVFAPPTNAPVSASSGPVAEGQDMVHTSSVSSGQGEAAAQVALLPGLGQTSQLKVNSAVAPAQASTVDRVATVETAGSVIDASQFSHNVSGLEDPAAATTQLMASDKATVEPEQQVNNGATPLDEDDFYSPAPATEPGQGESLVQDLPQTYSEAQALDAPSPSEEGEVEMSVSSEDEEEEYEPDELVVTEETIDQSAQLPGPEAAQSVASNDVSTEDEEAYEPPDIDEAMPDVQADVSVPETDSVEAGVEADIEAEDGEMDIASSSEDDSDSDSDSESESDGEIAEESANDKTISASNAGLQTINVADDLAPELQPENASQHASAAHEEVEAAKFTPYESPLRMFKSYRYHPNFTNDVTGGFMSSTFSHQIDPKKALCQYETAGGSCNDKDCPDQHFRDLGITGETLLVQLGTANPGKTQEEKQQWNDGLRSVLNDLRKRRIKDPSGIAAEITKYRREFLNDDTRVVNL